MYPMTFRTMRLAAVTTAVTASLVCAACATKAGSHGDDHSAHSTDPSVAEVDAGQAAARAAVEFTSLVPSMHDVDLQEVYLDPAGEVAVTLDVDGGTRFWPELRTGEAVTPLALPIHEPQWVSLARLGDTERFSLAWTDIAGRLHLAHVDVAKAGAAGRYTEAFVTAPSDPVFEAHVFEGGRRVLVLGHDHSIRLIDLSTLGQAPELDRYQKAGFVPWQLRVHSDAASTSAAAIVADPVRGAAITWKDDRLAIGGMTPPLPLDRGPNRNDVVLAPGGEAMFLLRRPGAKTKEVHIYRVDLATGAMTVLGGQVDARRRARMMATGPNEVLLETGTGNGYYFDVSQGIPIEEIKRVTRRNKERLDPAITHGREVLLPRLSGVPDTDWEEALDRYAARRMHVDMRSGLRVVPEKDRLIVDPLDADIHYLHGQAATAVHRAASSPTGALLAVGLTDELRVYGERDEPTHRVALDERPVALGFIDETHVAIYDYAEHLEVYELGDDGKLSSTMARDVPVHWRPEAARIMRDEIGPILLVRGDAPSDPYFRLRLDDGQASIEKLRGDEADAAADHIRAQRAAGGDGIRFYVEKRDAEWTRWSGSHHEPTFLVRAQGEVLSATPLEREHIAHLRASNDLGSLAVLQSQAVSLYDGSSLERRWTRAYSGAISVAWSEDSKRLFVSMTRGLSVVSAESGEQLREIVTTRPVHESRADNDVPKSD